MDRKLKQALKSAFPEPNPERKQAFLEKLTRQRTAEAFSYPPQASVSTGAGYAQFFIAQIGYIRKYVWILSVLVAILGGRLFIHYPDFVGGSAGKMETVWTASSILPFMALIMMTEISRSIHYNMEELEISCRYSLPQIISARMMIIGCADVILLIGILASVQRFSSYALGRLGVYILLPYLITCALCFLILNRTRGKDSFVWCTGVSVAVSMANGVLSNLIEALYKRDNLGWWIALTIISVIMIAVQLSGMLKRMEEMEWTYSLGN